MKKIRLTVCVLLLLISVLGTASCSARKRGSDNLYFRYFWWDDDDAYYIIETNVAGKTTEDGWDMIDAVIPTEYRGKPVTVIGWDSFRQCQILRSVIIPEGITGIHANTFFDCNSLESVHLPSSMMKFYGSCFASCNALREVTVDPDNPWFCSVDGVVFTKDGKELVFYPPGKTDEEYAIPEGCLTVGRYAFAYCENLKRISVPSTVNSISYESILFCRGLEGVFVDGNNQTYSSVDGNLYSKDGKQLVRLCAVAENTCLTLPEGVVEIAPRAAYGSSELTSVCFPESLTSIGESSFLGCSGLTSITIPENVTWIGSNAFSGCDGLREVIFEQTSGWSAVPQGGKFVSTAKLDTAELSAPATAAEYLAHTYVSREWRRDR